MEKYHKFIILSTVLLDNLKQFHLAFRITFRLFTTFFCARKGKMRSIFTGTKKCAGAKHHKGACADWCFAEAEPPKGGEA
jgi:hypothetical protein